MSEINLKYLTLADLQNSPVWAWKSDPFQSEDLLVPVAMKEEDLVAQDTLLIHANFLTASGVEREGLVVYDLDLDEVFAVEFLIGKDRITLNRNVSDISCRELERYAQITGESADGVLPIRFQVAPQELAIAPASFNLKASF